jgi:hypothetical protein
MFEYLRAYLEFFTLTKLWRQLIFVCILCYYVYSVKSSWELVFIVMQKPNSNKVFLFLFLPFRWLPIISWSAIIGTQNKSYFGDLLSCWFFIFFSDNSKCFHRNGFEVYILIIIYTVCTCDTLVPTKILNSEISWFCFDFPLTVFALYVCFCDYVNICMYLVLLCIFGKKLLRACVYCYTKTELNQTCKVVETVFSSEMVRKVVPQSCSCKHEWFFAIPCSSNLRYI